MKSVEQCHEKASFQTTSKMSANLEWFQKTVRDLPTQLDVKETVSSIKIALIGLNSTERKQIAENVQLSEVFECINSTDSEQVTMACDVLKVLLEVLDSSVVLKSYGTQITRALLHPSVPVKEVILQELYRAAGDEALISVLGELEGLLPGVAECMAHEEMSVASKSIKFFVRLGQSVSGLSLIYSPPSAEILRKLMFTSDVIRFRVYEIASELSVNPVGLEVGHNSGILPSLLQELKKDDVLLKMTTLELLSTIAQTGHGFEYLKAHSVLSTVAEDIVEAQNDPLSSILLPGFMKFFGNLGQRWPDFFFNNYSNVVEVIFDHVDSNDLNIMIIAIETIGYIVSTPRGKEILSIKAPAVMKHLAERIMEVVRKMPSDYRVRALNTITNIIDLKEEDQNEHMLLLSQEWFQCLGKVEETMELILTLCRQPFPEIHLAALQLVQAMAKQNWGQQYIHSQPGLIEVILDRDSKLQLESKKAKFEVIKTLAESPLTASVFGEDKLKEFKIFVKEGVVFVPVQTEIALEGAS